MKIGYTNTLMRLNHLAKILTEQMYLKNLTCLSNETTTPKTKITLCVMDMSGLVDGCVRFDPLKNSG